MERTLPISFHNPLDRHEDEGRQFPPHQGFDEVILLDRVSPVQLSDGLGFGKWL